MERGTGGEVRKSLILTLLQECIDQCNVKLEKRTLTHNLRENDQIDIGENVW